jgi:hypothetical protein
VIPVKLVIAIGELSIVELGTIANLFNSLLVTI